MSNPSWVEIVLFPDHPKKTKPCACFVLLGLGMYRSDGSVKVSVAEGAWDRGGVTIAGVGAQFCPCCGGKIERYSDEAIKAYQTFMSAVEGLSELPTLREFSEVDAYLSTRGVFSTSARSDYHIELVDERQHIKVIAGWDPDHEHVHATCRFFPGRRLEKQPFRE